MFTILFPSLWSYFSWNSTLLYSPSSILLIDLVFLIFLLLVFLCFCFPWFYVSFFIIWDNFRFYVYAQFWLHPHHFTFQLFDLHLFFGNKCFQFHLYILPISVSLSFSTTIADFCFPSLNICNVSLLCLTLVP